MPSLPASDNDHIFSEPRASVTVPPNEDYETNSSGDREIEDHEDIDL